MKLKFITENGASRVVDEDTGVELRRYGYPDMDYDAFGFHDPKAPTEVYEPGRDYLLIPFRRAAGPVSTIGEAGQVETQQRFIGYRVTPSSFWTAVGEEYSTRCIKDPAAFQAFVSQMLVFYLRHKGISEPVVEFVNLIPR